MPPFKDIAALTLFIHSKDASAWIRRFAHLVPAGGAVLDLAAGGGRHGRHFLGLGHPVTVVDRDVSGLADLAGTAEVIAADLEDGSPWPLPGRAFAAVVVTNYLHRPLFPPILATLAEGGVLLYETFARGQEVLCRPRNPAHLLEPGELLRVFGQELQPVAFEQGLTATPSMVQRLCAVRGAAPVSLVCPPG